MLNLDEIERVVETRRVGPCRHVDVMLDDLLVKVPVRETIERERNQAHAAQPVGKLLELSILAKALGGRGRKPEPNSHRFVRRNLAFDLERVFLQIRPHSRQIRPRVDIGAITRLLTGMGHGRDHRFTAGLSARVTGVWIRGRDQTDKPPFARLHYPDSIAIAGGDQVAIGTHRRQPPRRLQGPDKADRLNLANHEPRVTQQSTRFAAGKKVHRHRTNALIGRHHVVARFLSADPGLPQIPQKQPTAVGRSDIEPAIMDMQDEDAVRL